MHRTLETNKLSWHHFTEPSPNDVAFIRETFGVHPIVLHELTRPTARPLVESDDGYLYLVLHFPIFNDQERKTYAREVDFILTQEALVTVAYDAIPPLDEFFIKCSSEEDCRDLFGSKTVAHLASAVIRSLYEFALRELDHISEHIDALEHEVFSTEREEQRVIERLFFLRRDVIEFRRALKPQQSALESLVDHGVQFYGHAAKPFLDGLVGEYSKVWNLLENHKEAVDALYENNVAILNIKQNQAMKAIAVISFITFPLMLFTALFSMDARYTPIVGRPHDFWIIIGIMAVASFAMFLVFRRKRWI